MLSPESIASIRDSWKAVEPLAPEAANNFYGRLFELDPGLRHLFTGDMGEQGQKLMRMIAIAVNGLDRLPEIIPAIEDLGRRHHDYGVSTADYDKVGAALLWTLERALGSRWTPALQAAWQDAYTIIADAMIRASEGGC